MIRRYQFVLAVAACLTVCDCAAAAQEIRAFPGAEGFGMYSKGGRGGRVLFVTNLDDYDPANDEPIPGSLRAACLARGPRVVVFRVSGTIELKSSIKIKEPYLTIAGQSAPGDGICVKNHAVYVQASHVIIRHMRFRPGDQIGRQLAEQGENWNTDALSVSGWNIEEPIHDIIFDHCSASWANDEVLSVSGPDIANVTVQWCIIAESLSNSPHEKGEYGYGSLIRTNGNVTFHHNLYAYHRSRSPRPGTDGEGSLLLDFRNNVIHRGGAGYCRKDPMRMNYIGNHISRTKVFDADPSNTMYVEGNYLVDGGAKNADNWQMINGQPRKAKEPFSVAAVTTHSAKAAYGKVLASCGAILPRRDAVDTRITRQVEAGNGTDSAEVVLNWPELRSASPPKDADMDGMPDAWEKKHGLNPTDASDNGEDADSDGYTNIEEYLNDTDPRAADRA